MKMTHAAVAALISLAAVGANAADVSFQTAMQDTAGTVFDLTRANTTGGLLLTAGEGDAALPTGTVGTFLAAEPSNAATVNLGYVSSVSFEWGTPDLTWNTLEVKTSNGVTTYFTPGTLNLSGDTYVDFTAASGLAITSLKFDENTYPAFEAANFKVTAVPEPTNVALLLAGLGLVGVVARRRRI